MDLSFIFMGHAPDEGDVSSWGFRDNRLRYDIPETDLYAVYTLDGASLSVDVFDSWDEKYGPFYAELPLSFVGGLRYAVTEYAEKTFMPERKEGDEVERVQKLFRTRYSIEEEFPWKDKSSGIFRSRKSGKWIAGLFVTKASSLKLGGEGFVHVLNLKSDRVEELVDGRTIFPAWHMNHRLWISLLVSAVDDDLLEKLVEESKALVE